MQKISDSTNTANAAGEFTEGNPAAGAAATLLKASWLNAIQRELAGLVLGAGINLNAADDEQVLKAVKLLAEGAADFEKLKNLPTTIKGYGILDSFSTPIQSEDYNALGKCGLYGLGSSTAANRPLGFNGSYAFNHTAAGYGFTLSYNLANDGVAFRRKTPDGFGAWRFLWHSGNFDPDQKATKATTLAGYGITDAVSAVNTASDYNALTQTGLYLLGMSSTANRPPGFNGSGAINHLMAGYGFTLAYDLGADAVAFRREEPGGFGAWRTLWHSGSFDPTLKANLASPALTGVPTAPTASVGSDSQQVANCAFVWVAVNAYATTVSAALGFKANLASPAFTGVPTAPTAAVGTNTDQIASTAFVQAATSGIDPWAMQPIGVPIPLLQHIASDSTPPTNKGYRYISLTANDTYNGGVLTGEVVSGSFPLISATAVISLVGSPVYGKTINLINTEQRVLRGSPSPGQLLQDSLQNIAGSMTYASVNSASGALSFSRIGQGSTYDGSNAVGTVTFDASLVARTSSETRAKSIGVVYFMRIK